MKKLLILSTLFAVAGNQAQASFLDSMNKIKGYFYNKSPLYGCEGNFAYRGNDKYLIVDKVQNTQGDTVVSLELQSPSSKNKDLQITFGKETKLPISSSMTIDKNTISTSHLNRNLNQEFVLKNNSYILKKKINVDNSPCGILTYERSSILGKYEVIETHIPDQKISYNSYFVPRVSYTTIAGTTLFGAFLGFVYTKTKS